MNLPQTKPGPVFLRIHGDNIIECERGLHLIADSYSAVLRYVVGPPYMPRYEIFAEGALLFDVELLPGHGRWGVNIQDIFRSHGAPLREATDIVITKIVEGENECSEEILLAVEFSSALPAGNNAWQRNGRALACAVAGVPYLYFTEVGGVELGENRIVKAPRFPNPIVPFSYLTASEAYQVLCLPVYALSPSCSESIGAQFEQMVGVEDACHVVRCVLESHLPCDSQAVLFRKAIAVVNILAESRKREDTLRGDEWAEFLTLDTGAHKVAWLTNRQSRWQKKRASKVQTTETFQNLTELFASLPVVSVGASDIPICLIPGVERRELATRISHLYGNSLDAEFVRWLDSDAPLLIVWITGFKPRGDDSRPDRGLVPLARMLFGDEIEILSIVSGPAKPEMWAMLRENAEQLAQQNGLWEAVLHLSDAVIVDSPTLTNIPLTLLLTPVRKQNRDTIRFPMASSAINFSEYDVDTVIHLLFSTGVEAGIFEAMCNPPGGDWSGLSVMDFRAGVEYRWTSLPRVSAIGGKRPDHVIQLDFTEKGTILLAIESKDVPAKIQTNLGSNLKAYVGKLLEIPPVTAKAPNSAWRLWQAANLPVSNALIMSGGAFCWTGEHDLLLYLEKCQFDFVMAVEFDSVEQTALLHMLVSSKAEFLLPSIHHLAQRFGGRLKIKVH